MTKVNPFKEISNTPISYDDCLVYLKGCSKDELLQNVREALTYIEKTHRYSMSRLYALWNFIFSRNEAPKSCASCLIRKSRDLSDWMRKEEIASIVKAVDLAEKKIQAIEETTKDEPKKATKGKRKEK